MDYIDYLMEAIDMDNIDWNELTIEERVELLNDLSNTMNIMNELYKEI